MVISCVEVNKCGANQIGQGKQFREGKMFLSNNMSIIGGSDIISDICTNCGYILEMRVKEPERFRRKG